MTGHSTPLDRTAVNADWIPVSLALTGLSNFWASRRDLKVYLGRDGGKGAGAAAFYDPTTGHIEVNSELAFGKGSQGSAVGNLLDRMELSKHPIAGGLTLHESMHARYSTSDLRQMRKRFDTEAQFDVYQHLEETRIEGRAVINWPADAPYLRASCKDLLMAEGPDKWGQRAAAVLLLGRETVGVLTPDDIKPVEDFLAINGWEQSVLDRLRDIVDEFVMLNDDNEPDIEQMVKLAIELDHIMPREEPEGGEGEGSGQGEGEGGEELSDILGELLDAIGKALDAAAVGGRIEVVQEAQKAKVQGDREQAAADKETEDNNKRVAKIIFGDEGVHPELRGGRPPTAPERSAAVVLSRALEKARYRAHIVTEYDSRVPIGRFNGSEAMRLKAARTVGAPTESYKPFRKQERQETEKPPLTVGIMCDTSGSMSGVQPAVGTAVWVMSDAVYRIGKAAAATIYFGADAVAGLKKGERLREVRTWSGGGGYENFNEGFKAIDGELNLLRGKGARLLFVISDGSFKNGPGINQNEARDRWLNTCVRNGVAVVWLGLNGEPYVNDQPGVKTVVVSDDLLETIDVIGSACTEALARVSGL